MAKQLNIDLSMTANTSQAKKELQSLQQQLEKLSNISNFSKAGKFTITDEIIKASQAAAQLKIQLEQATNVNTGKLDLGKFSESLKNSNMSLEKYSEQLSLLGNDGQKAFSALATSVTKAEIPLKRSNALLSEFATTLKNTARWQISSSILHGFMGSLSAAYGYAQNLNQSLNNIRIVTGYGNDEMAKFAESANKAAQALSTTTTNYTDAALIYYQQGIRDQEEIAGRTETTIKLANVSRQSAEEVSSQMTAIWNNFDDGSKSLEYYADVITALGANTAASSEEIASGMSKFAAVAETVGLSYEYAASSLATIVATTRQSEDTVGTGLRTIFSRLEGLKLGETLEDGVDLNKYSAALKTIGVDILDATGQLKQMDTILDETAQHWDNLDRAQKVAFATTVGGVRQYTNLIALLDNWDMMQENVGIAKGSEGTLQEQADIYAESWEAAQKRVRAAAEDIYKSLLNDKFFITLNNSFAIFLKGINSAIDGIGGLKGVLLTLGAIITSVFHNQIVSSLKDVGYNLKMLTQKGRDSVKEEQQNMINLLANNAVNSGTAGGALMSDAYKEQATLSQSYINNAERMTEVQRELASQSLDTQRAMISSLEEETALMNDLEGKVGLTEKRFNETDQEIKEIVSDSKLISTTFGLVTTSLTNISKTFSKGIIPKEGLEEVQTWYNTLSNSLQDLFGVNENKNLDLNKVFGIDNGTQEKFIALGDAIASIKDKTNPTDEELKKLNQTFDTFIASTATSTIDLELLELCFQELGYSQEEAKEKAKEFVDTCENLGIATGNASQQLSALENYTKKVSKSFEELSQKQFGMLDGLTTLSSNLMSIGMLITSITSLINMWGDESKSTGEKIVASMTSIGLLVPRITKLFDPKNTAALLQVGNGIRSVAGASTIAAEETLTFGTVLSGIIVPIGAVIAALSLLIGVIYLVAKAYNKSADDAKKASKTADGLKEQYQKTKESYEELKKSVEDHENAVKAIDKLKHGTEEWRDAIQEANEKVLELIGNYPQLAAAVSRNKDGILTIDESSSAYKSYMSDAEDQMRAASYGSLGGKVLSNEANYNNDLVQASRTITYQSENSTKEGRNLYRQVSPEDLRKAVELYNQDASSFNKDSLMEALNTSNENLCQALIDNTSQIAELSAELSANTSANELAAQEIGMSELAKNNPNVKDEYIQAVGGMLGDQFTQELKKQNSLWEDRGVSSYYSDKEAQQKYAKSMGYTWDRNLGGNKGRYLDQEGNAKEIPDSVARTFLAVQDATAAISKNLDSAKQAIDNLQVGVKNFGNEIGDKDSAFSLLTGTSGGEDFNFSELTEEQFKGVKKAWETAAGRDGKSGVTGEEFLKYFGITDEYAKSKGYDSGLAMAQAFANGINNYANDVKYKNILESLMPNAKSFEEASAKYNTITSAGDKITEDNYILDDKSYQELEAAGIAVDQYFEQMADGTHLLISSVNEFKSAVDSVANSELYTALTNQEKITGSLEAYSASGADSSLLTDQDKNNILQFSGVSSEDVANIQMIEDSTARSIAYAEKFKELGLDGDIEKINELLQQSADETQKIQNAIENSQFKDKVADSGLDLEETIEYSKHLQRLAKNEENAYIGADKLSEELVDNDTAAKNLSLQVQRMNKGVESLSKNWKNWSDMLKNSSKGSKEYYDALDDTKEALSDLLNISEDFIDDKFVDSLANNADSMKLMEEAAKGNGDAIDELRQKTLKNIVLNLELNDSKLDNNALWERVQGLQSMLDSMGPIEVGATIDTSGLDAGEAEFIAALNQLIVDAGLGKEAVNAMLSGMGFTANFATEPQKVMRKEPDEVTTHVRKVSKGVLPVEGGGSVEEYDMITTTETKPGKEVPGTIDASSMITTEPGTTVVPKINSLTKNASGSANNSSSSNKGGSGGGKGGGGGGGGGGSSKPAKKKDVTKKNDGKEIDRYIKINQQLAQKEHESNLLKTKLDSTSGQTAIKVMKEQLDILKQQKGLYGELSKEAENYRVKDLEKLKQDFADLSFQIDPSDGMLMNYEALLKEQTDLYNKVYNEWTDKIIAAEKEYNAQIEILGEAATEEALKPWAEAIEKLKEESKDPLREAEERYELFKKDTDKYNDSVEQARKAAEEAAAKELEAYNQELEIIAKGVELKIKVDDADLQYLEFLLKQIGEGADRALDRMSNYTQSLTDNMNKIEKYQEGLGEVLDHAGIDFDELLDGDIDDLGSFNEEDLAKVEEYRDGLISCGEQLLELRETLLNEVRDAFDEFNSDLDRSIEKIEHLKSFTETYKNLIDIVGKRVLDPLGKTTLMLARTTYTQAESNTKALKSQLDYQLSVIEDYNRVISDLESKNDNGQHDDTIKEFKDQLKEAEDAYASTQENWLSSWEETVQAAADIYEAELNQILEDFSNSISGMMRSLDDLSEEYSRIQTIQDIYVDDYEKIYQLSKLNRDINKSLDDSTTLASKAKLRDIQKEINDLQESGVEVSQYDLDVLRKKYEMALAYEQWQDAQNAKTVVRMQRDNEGNYGYVYTADQADVEAAEQNYEDKLHEMQVLNAEYIQSLQEQIIQAQQDCADALANLRAQDFASYEEYQDAVEQIRKDYTKRVETLSQQMGNAMDNNRTLYEQDWTAYHEATGYKISADENYIDKFNETVYSQLTGFQTMEEAQNAFVSAVNDAADLAAQNWEDWYIRTNSALDLGGNSMQNYTEEVDEAINGSGGLVEQTQDAEDAVHEMANEYDTAFTEIIDYAWNFADDFDSVIQNIIEGCNNAIEAIMRLLEAMAELEGEDDDDDDSSPMQANDYKWKNLKEGTGEYEWVYENSQGNRKKGTFSADWTTEQGEHYWADYDTDENGIVQASPENFLHNGYFGSYNKRTSQYGEVLPAEVIPMGNNDYELETGNVVVISRNTDVQSKNTSSGPASDTSFDDLVKYYGPGSFDTGGYTGDWGSSKRMAFLHEKELVLNADDTKNILSAVDMIRSISKTIDLNAIAAGSIFASPNSAYKSSFGSRDSLEQNVRIQAEFPNVSDHNEIEEALNNLIERAAQFAGRKNL